MIICCRFSKKNCCDANGTWPMALRMNFMISFLILIVSHAIDASAIITNRFQRSTDTCGVPVKISGYVYYGRRFSRGDFPWIVALMTTKYTQQLDYFCGGSLISKTFVVSGKHIKQAVDTWRCIICFFFSFSCTLHSPETDSGKAVSARCFSYFWCSQFKQCLWIQMNPNLSKDHYHPRRMEPAHNTIWRRHIASGIWEREHPLQWLHSTDLFVGRGNWTRSPQRYRFRVGQKRRPKQTISTDSNIDQS